MTTRALKTCVFYCSNHFEADQFASMLPGPGHDSFKTIALPCSGKVDIPYLIKAFETGADALVIVRCKTNECRHFEGNLRAHKRAQAVSALLEEIGCDGRRITVLECPEGGATQILSQIKHFLESLGSAGCQPAVSQVSNLRNCGGSNTSPIPAALGAMNAKETTAP